MIKKIFYCCLAILFILASALGGCSSKSPGFKKGSIETGKQTIAITKSVDLNGATITVTQADSPLNGLVLTIPPNSYPGTRQFKISSAPIQKHTFGEDFNPISPLISIENGGGYANEIITMKIPVRIPDGHFAMAFYYDGKRGKLEGIPLIDVTASSITIATRHFSNIVVSSIAESALGADVEVDTGFTPGIDDWQFTNYGSYIAPGGHCAGQAITALWYYTQMKSAGEPSLYGRYNEGTRDLWEDDARAYRFASTIQNDVDWEAWSVRYNKLKPKAQQDNSIVWKQFVYSMKLTGDPQFVAITNTIQGGGHAMIVYAVSGGALHIADPNYPGRNDRQIWYEDREFEPYNSGANAQAILEGKGKAYDLILYFGTSSMVDFDRISARWSEFQEDTIGNDRFPGYTIKTLNEDGDEIELPDGYVSKNKTIPIYVYSESAELGICLYRDFEPIAPAKADVSEFELKPGNNHLGIYVLGYKDGDWEYVDFQYLNIKYEEPKPTATKTTEGKNKPVITAFTGPNKFEFDANLRVVGIYKFSVSVEGGTPPYYYIWKGARAPQSLKEGTDCPTITISPQDMRQPGSLRDGFFLWVTVKDSKGNYATWGPGNTEFMYGLKFTGRFETKDGVTRLVENTWQVLTEP